MQRFKSLGLSAKNSRAHAAVFNIFNVQRHPAPRFNASHFPRRRDEHVARGSPRG